MTFSLADQPALLLGNGPSLRDWDLAEDCGQYHTFGMNAAYRYWEQIGWWPDYYACLDLVVGESHLNSIRDMVEKCQELGIQRFLLRENVVSQLGDVANPQIDCYESLVAKGELPYLPDITTGSHTMLWAQLLGYRTIFLAGIDLGYVERVENAEFVGGALQITHDATNPNYFFEGYQRTGDKYNLPNPRPDLHLNSWANAADSLELDTVVLNFNISSRLRTFVLCSRPGSCENSTIQGFAPNPDDLANRLYEINQLRYDISAVEALAARLDKLRLRNEWCARVFSIDDRSEDCVPVGLFYDQANRRFSTDTEHVAGAFCLIRTIDSGLLFRTLDAVIISGQPGWWGKAFRVLARAQDSIRQKILPSRLRMISIRENVMDIGMYYKSVRGFVVIMLQGLLAAAIALPSSSAIQFFVVWLILILLFPLASRKA